MNTSVCSRCSAAAARFAANLAAPHPPRSCHEAVFVALASVGDYRSAVHKASCLFQLQPPTKITDCPFKLAPWQLQNVANVCSSSERRDSACCSVSLLFFRIAAAKLAATSSTMPQRLARACVGELGPRMNRERICSSSISSDTILNSARRGCNSIASLGELQRRLVERDTSLSHVMEACDGRSSSAGSASCLGCRRAALDAAYAAAWPDLDAATLQSCTDLTFLMLASNASAAKATQIGGCLYALPVSTPEDDAATAVSSSPSSSSPPLAAASAATPPAPPQDDVSMSLLPDPVVELAHQSPSAVTIALAIGIGITGATVALLLVLVLLLQRKKEESVPLCSKGTSSGSISLDAWQGPEAIRSLRSFKYWEIEKATNKFHCLIGQGRGGGSGSGSAVYRAKFKDGLVAAVKRFHHSPPQQQQQQREQEFKSEAHLLGRLHHRHLVSLRGFCVARNQRFLVYDFLENGNLKDRLQMHHHRASTLSWQRRLQIAIDVATGMEYVHCYCEPALCHGNIKSSNILLDDNFVAKIADFRLAAAYRTPETGYADPELSSSGAVTDKSDVYSFGIVLLELVSSRPAIAAGNKDILDWSHEFYSFGDSRLMEMVDPAVRDEADPGELKRIITVSRLCTQSEAKMRPTTKQVVSLLLDNAIALFPPLSFSAATTAGGGDGFDGDDDDETLSIHSAAAIPSFSTNARHLFLFGTSPHAPSFSSYSTYSSSYS